MPSLSRLESGQRRPSLEVLLPIAEAFKVPLDELIGALRLLIADHDVVMKAGEVAEFDTQVPHWFGATGDRPVEILSLLGKRGERIHVRAGPKRRAGT
jgi:transcriptional regulator with XRE-family HTH domain